MIASDTLVDQVIARTIELASVPAPPLDEQDRADLIVSWWQASCDEVTTDDIGNVWGRARKGDGPAVVIAAHMDTVFPRDVHHPPERNGDVLQGPSVGDDSVAVAALDAATQLLPDDTGEVWLLATVGEEGLGNLIGMKHAIAEPLTSIDAIIAIEGNWLGRICTTAVGSVRYRSTLTGPGGHAWEASEVDSAIHAAARIVADIDALTFDSPGRWSANVGVISGGTGINVRAPSATFDVDLRSEDAPTLAELDQAFQAIVAKGQGDVEAELEELGRRPAGKIDHDHRLAVAASNALQAVGVDVQWTAASTDANAAHGAGIPALAVGITHGAGEHTLDEWIDLTQIGTGLEALALTITNYKRSRS